MARNVEYFFTPVSPFTYLGHQRFVAMVERHGVAVDVKPVDLGPVFAASGGLPLKQRAPQRQAYRLVELARWSKYLGLPLNLQPRHFPVPPAAASKWILAASSQQGAGAALKLTGALLRGVWAEERNIAESDTLAAIATEQGFDAKTLAERAAAADIGERYDALTQEAIARQVFGAPTYIYRDEPFWGQDRLDFLERALAK
ncbi:MAG TPA: 2-hydroxychromene-2-carboxylate isomerase [Casimicrobiaceae bacterium]|nr:2-hydroxychromene-2-carboxylate isomerase [Casimicrobiaceae bacterium]